MGYSCLATQVIAEICCRLKFSAPKASRFVEADEEFIEELKTPVKTKTRKETQTTGLTFFNNGQRREEKNEQLASYEVPQLNDALAQFFAELRWGSDEEYEPDSLKVMHAIKKQKLSLSSRKVLVGKARKLSELGMGKRKNKAQSLTKEEEEILWDNGQLGDKIPRPLINTVR